MTNMTKQRLLWGGLGIAALVALMFALGCGANRNGVKMEPEGEIALKGAQVLSTLEATAPGIEPMVDAKVLTVDQALVVTRSIREALAMIKPLPDMLMVVDSTRDLFTRNQTLTQARDLLSRFQQKLTALPAQVSSQDDARLANPESADKAQQAVKDLLQPTLDKASDLAGDLPAVKEQK